MTSLPIAPGVNQVKRLGSDGSAGLISLAWRDNGNAWGYSLYTVMLPAPRGGWNVVGFDRPDRAPSFSDTIADTPHTGEDNVRAIRFAEATVNGKRRVVLLQTTRDYGDDITGPATTTYDVFAVVSSGGDSGTTPDYFARLSRVTLPSRYCNADAALSQASGLPLRPGYEGRKTPTGC